jgi:hypothetical protein
MVSATLSLFLVPPASVLANPDFSQDGLLNEVDVNLLTAEIAAGTSNLVFDVNVDGAVNADDLDGWFPLYSTESGVPLATALVDVNFDTVNTIADFQIIQSNLLVATTDFTAGNLNADSLVDVSDRNLYIIRGGVVPEPATLVLTALGLLAVAGRRRKPTQPLAR